MLAVVVTIFLSSYIIISVQASKPGSCQVGGTKYCGKQSPDKCWCDKDSITKYNDNCADIATICPEIAGLDQPTTQTTSGCSPESYSKDYCDVNYKNTCEGTACSECSGCLTSATQKCAAEGKYVSWCKGSSYSCTDTNVCGAVEIPIPPPSTEIKITSVSGITAYKFSNPSQVAWANLNGVKFSSLVDTSFISYLGKNYLDVYILFSGTDNANKKSMMGFYDNLLAKVLVPDELTGTVNINNICTG